MMRSIAFSMALRSSGVNGSRLEVVVEAVGDRRADAELRIGSIVCTACAITCAVEWRRMLRPSGEYDVTGSTVSFSVTVVARSFSSPLTRMATTARSVNRSNPVCEATRVSDAHGIRHRVVDRPAPPARDAHAAGRLTAAEPAQLEERMRWSR